MDRVTDKAGLGYYTPEELGQVLAFFAGCILVVIGALRLGLFLKFIPRAAIDAYATCAALRLIIGQLPALFGLVGVSNQGSSFVVLVDVIHYIGEISADVAFGISAVAVPVFIGWLCTALSMRYPQQQRVWDFVSTLCFPAVISLSILGSYLVFHDQSYGGPIETVGPIEPGFIRAHIPTLPRGDLIKDLCSEIPAVVLLMVVSQAALLQRMASLNGYSVNSSQELIALGVVNIFGPSLGGYLTMGSFSSSTILSMACSRSPLAGVFAALMVVMTLYLLMGVFSYTPVASLAGIVIYSMFTSLPRPTALYRNFRYSPVHSFIWIISLAAGLAYSLEWSLYTGTILKWLIHFAPPVSRKKTLVVHPGVFVHRLSDDLCYFNEGEYLVYLSEFIRQNTILCRFRAVVLDFEGVKTIDYESVQGLSKLRRELESLGKGGQVDWVCVNVSDFWARRSLIEADFDPDTFDECVETAVEMVKKENAGDGGV